MTTKRTKSSFINTPSFTFLCAAGMAGLLLMTCSKKERSNPLDSQNPSTQGDPFGLTSELTSQGVKLTWKAVGVSGVTGYKIQRNASTLSALEASATQYTDTSIYAESTYVYAMCAVSGSTQSESGKPVTVKIDSSQLCITPAVWAAPHLGGTLTTVQVTNCGTTGKIFWTGTKDSSWLTVTPTNHGITPKTLKLSVPQNTTGQSRSARLIVSADGINSDTLTVTQDTTGGTVTDIDDNVYQTVTIGTQVWMAENLKVTRYRNGRPISKITDGNTWWNLTTAAYCENQAATYGKLYNWYAVIDSQNIAPEGWHVATDAEWKELVTHLGGTSDAGGKLKEAGTVHWCSSNIATNEYLFSALPAGYRYSQGVYDVLGNNANFWASAGNIDCYFTLGCANENCDRHYDNDQSIGCKRYGLSIRCVRD
jgi:uncharacterized protein (TIGR02145 family)